MLHLDSRSVTRRCVGKHNSARRETEQKKRRENTRRQPHHLQTVSHPTRLIEHGFCRGVSTNGVAQWQQTT